MIAEERVVMNRQKSRVIRTANAAWIIFAVILFIAIGGLTANAETIDSGNCSLFQQMPVTWTLDDSGVLQISSESGGFMAAYAQGTAPWYKHKDKITSVRANNIGNVGKYAFYGCSKIKTVEFSRNIGEIGVSAFEGCSNLEAIRIQNNPTNTITSDFIKERAFKGCSMLKNITVNASFIEEGAFSGCNNLESITVPFIGKSAVATQETALFGYIFGPDAYSGGIYTEQPYAMSEKYSASYGFYMPEKLKTVTVAGSALPDWSFAGCKNIRKIILPNGISKIGERTFYNCSDLADVTIPSSVNTIEEYAFSECSSLEVKIPAGVTSIAKNNFDRSLIICEANSYAQTYAVNNGYRYDLTSGHQEGPGITTKTATCTEDGTIEYSCKTCRRVLRTASIPKTGHNWDKGYVSESPTCEKEGKKTFLCMNGGCSEIKTEPIAKLGHDWNDLWSYDEESHWHTCKRGACDAKDSLAKHILETVIIKEATCSEKGIAAQTCKTCNYSKETELPILSHNIVFVPAKEATAIRAGNKEHWRCSLCGRLYSDAKGQNEITEGDVKIDMLPAEPDPLCDHEWDELEIEATCIKEGSFSIRCIKCGMVKEGSEKIFPKKDHSYGDWITNKESTEISTGEQIRKCLLFPFLCAFR